MFRLLGFSRLWLHDWGLVVWWFGCLHDCGYVWGCYRGLASGFVAWLCSGLTGYTVVHIGYFFIRFVGFFGSVVFCCVFFLFLAVCDISLEVYLVVG